MLNNLSIYGRLTKNAELKKTQSGISVCRFSIANDRTSGENKITDFFDVVAWRKTAEFVAQYFKKGDGIIITGRIETNEFTDRDGVQRKTVQINAYTVEFAGGRVKTTNNTPNAQNANNGQISANSGTPQNGVSFDSDENLPFPLDMA